MRIGDGKVKVRIVVELDDIGRLNVNTTTENILTSLGMLELAKKILSDTKKVEEPSAIERV